MDNFFENNNQSERDSTIIEGTLQFIDHAPIADMMFLGLSIDGSLKTFDYSGSRRSCKGYI